MVEICKLGKPEWSLYPIFEDRVRKFAISYDMKCPIQSILEEMLQRWITQPAISGYFVALEEGQMVGHLASWINSTYGTNRLYIFQAEMDSTHPSVLSTLLDLLKGWIEGLNQMAHPDARVRLAEFVTWHSAEKWARYLQRAGVKSTKVCSLIQMELF